MEQEKQAAGNPKSSIPNVFGMIAILLLIVLASTYTLVDRTAAGDYESLFQRAFVTFALARTLNGVISAVQGTEVALQPAGVGVTLTPGEILDPVNDLVERFSWIMLGATLSLGIQQVLLDIGQWWGVRLLLGLSGLAWMLLRLCNMLGTDGRFRTSGAIALRIFMILVFIRFAVPVTLIANEALYREFLESRYESSTQVIEVAGAEIERVGTPPPADDADQEGGLMESLERALESTRESLDLKRRVEFIKQRASDVIEHLIQLSVVFILQTAILPVAFLWLFLQLIKQWIKPPASRNSESA